MAQPGGGNNNDNHNAPIGQQIAVGVGVLAAVAGTGYLLFKAFQGETEENATATTASYGDDIDSECSFVLREKAAVDNRANQLNPNHFRTGPGRPSGYTGIGDKADLDNHANQKNPNNSLFQGKRHGFK